MTAEKEVNNMSEHDVKTKPKTTPKMVVRSKDIAVNAVKDRASVMKDVAVKKAIESKLGTEQQEQHRKRLIHKQQKLLRILHIPLQIRFIKKVSRQ